ncbi:MAG: YbbR-like domain-containing protein [Gemmatimonadaceae bacterium]
MPTGGHSTGGANPRPSSAQPRVRTPVQRRLLSAFTERLHLKAAAILFALLLWFVVSAEELSEQVLPVTLALTLDSSIELRAPPPPVNALIEGRGRDLLKLWQNHPTLRRKVGLDTPDSMTFELRAGDIELGGVNAHVREIEPKTITIRFDVNAQRMVPVRSALRVATDSGRTGTLVFEPESVLVRGRRGIVRSLGAVSTAPVTIDGRDTMQLVPLDTAGLAVTVRPSRVRVHVRALHEPTHDTAPPTPRPAGDNVRRDSGKRSSVVRDSAARRPGRPPAS